MKKSKDGKRNKMNKKAKKKKKNNSKNTKINLEFKKKKISISNPCIFLSFRAFFGLMYFN